MKNYYKKIGHYLKRPDLWIYRLLVQFPSLVKNDELFVTAKWKLAMPYPLNLNNPKTFNEKLQWLKLYDHQPAYTKMVDKVAAKEYVASIIGGEHIIKTLGVYDRFDDIDFDALPNRFVLKVAHDSGGIVICKNKATLDVAAARKKLSERQKHNYYTLDREWPYKNVPPRILCEEYMEDENSPELKDYKFFCFDGEPMYFRIDYGRFLDGHHANYYDTKGLLLPFAHEDFPPILDKEMALPQHLNEMLEYAKALSKNIPFLRVDFYETNNRVYFGELTFYPGSGRNQFTDMKWDEIQGSYLTLPKTKTI
jgi:hypothetical protein